MSNLLKRTLSLVIALVMVLGLLPVTSLAATTEVVFTLGDDGEASHNDGTTLSGTTYDAGTVEGYTLSFTDVAKGSKNARDAKGNGCYRVGTSSVTGSFTFTVPEDVTSVVIAVAQYKANTTKIDVNGTEYTITTASNNGEYTDITVDTSSSKTVTFKTLSDGKRAMVNTITYVIGSDDSGSEEPACDHDGTVVTDAAVAATCTETGLTEGSHCTNCGEVIVKQVVVPALGHSYVSFVCTACGDTLDDYSGRYYIATARTDSNYFYMTSDLGTASTKRYQAVDSGLTVLPDSIEGGEADKIFVLHTDGDGTYTICAEGVEGNNYLGYTSGNSGTLVAADEALKLTVDEQEGGQFRIHFAASDEERYLSMNGTTGNNYYAWYKSGQKMTLDLIPVEEASASCEHEYTNSCDQHCALCGELTNPDAAHTIEKVEAKAATCYEEGNIEYWYCTICGAAWADEALTQVTNQKSVVLPAAHAEATHVEAVAPTCYEDGNIEYWYCEACGQAWLDAQCTLNTNLKAVVLPAAHAEATHVEAKAATCYEEGNIEYWYCEACGQAWLDAECTLNTNLKAVVLPMAHGTITHVEAKAATVNENGNIEYWYCEACGQAWLDADCTLNTNLKAVVLPKLEAVAQVGEDLYASLAEAIAVGGEVTVLTDIELTAPITVAAGQTVVLNLNGKTVTYNSTIQGETMITNKGNLTINDTEGGVINYNYTGEADSTYSKGNYTISNEGTLTVNGGKITIANLRAHAKYPINNNSTSGDAILVINGGHLYNYNTAAIRLFCNSTTHQNSVTINGGLIEGYSAIWMQNPGSRTVNGQLSITGGEIRTTAAAYVNGTADLKDVASKLYCTTEGGAWSEGSSVSITGGTINENVYLAEEAPATLTIGDATFNGNLKLPVVYVAQVGETKYETLAEAVEAAEAGATVILLGDTTGAGVVIDKDITIDLGGYTYTVNSAVGSTGTETLAFQILAGSNATPYNVTLKNGTIAVVEEPVEGSNELKVVIMNYSNLTLEDITVDGTGNSDMVCVLANNNGASVLKGETNIDAGVDGYAIDVDGDQDYYGAVSLTIETTGTITGTMAVYGEEAAATINSGSYTVDVTEWCAEGYIAVKNENGTYGVVVDPAYGMVAKIGDTYYATLAEAIAVGGEVTLLTDVELTETITVAAGNTVVLNLNGHTVSGVSSEAKASAVIINKGNLTVTGEGTITSSGVADEDYGEEGYPTYANNTINNYGTLVIENGTIQNATAADKGAFYAIDNYAGGSVTINGGLVECVNGFAIRQFSSGTAVNSVTVNGGEVKGTRAVWMQAAGSNTDVAANMDLTVNGGKLTATGESETFKLAVYVYSYGNSLADTSITITDGAIEGDIALCGGKNKTASETVTVTGGTFNGDLYSYADAEVTEGKVVVTGGEFTTEYEDVKAYVPYWGTITVNGEVYTNIPELPDATVANLGAIYVEDYGIYNGSFVDGGDPITLQVAMQFVANDSAEEAAAHPYADWTTDFYITVNGLANGSINATGCYLAGHYGDFGWVMIPLDGMTIEEGKIYPVITSVGLDFSYEDICTSVKDFKCGIYFTDKVLNENPELEVTLTLGLSEDIEAAQATEFKTVDEYTYKADELNVQTVAAVEGELYDTLYASLAEAVEAAPAGGVVKLLADSEGDGIVINKDITIYLGGYTYTVSGETVGSTGTTTLGFQILAGNDVAIKNGKINTNTNACKMLVQNYANLHLNDVTLDGTGSENMLYVLSNNCGNIVLEGNTNITAPEGAVAFDVYDYSSAGYALPEMVVDTTGTISGNIEVSETASLTINSGSYTVDVTEWCGFGLVSNGLNGTWTVAQISDLTSDLVSENDFTATVTVEAGATVYYQSYRVVGMLMSINGGEAVECVGDNWSPYVWSITNDGDAAAEYVITVAFPVGSMNNPAELSTEMANYFVAGSDYYFNWTAPADGTLTISVYAEDADWNPLGWFYVVNNLTSYAYGDQHTSADEPVVEQEVITVKAGDLIEVVANTFNPEDKWNAPVGDMYVYASFACAEHGETYIEDNYDGETHNHVCVACGATVSNEPHSYDENDTCVCGAVKAGTETNPINIYGNYTATIAAGETVYFCANYKGGQDMTINGGEAVTVSGMYYNFSITNDTDAEATYEIVFVQPVGSYMNPAELSTEMANYSNHAEGSAEYYYTWTAPADGTLTLSFYAEDADWNALGWFYSISNQTTGVAGDNQWSDSDPVANPVTIEVAEGDEIMIVVNTYDPSSMWAPAPAGDMYVTATFECAEHGETSIEDNYDGETHNYVCSACGATVSNEPHSYDENGNCVCGAVKAGTETNPINIYGNYTATIAAGETVYFCANYKGGQDMTINDGEAVTVSGMYYNFSITNDGDAEATYEIKFIEPVGTWNNPAELVIGDNVSEHAEGSMEYYYTYTATEDGELTLSFATDAAGWFYSISNQTTGVAGDNQWSDSDPVANPVTIEVAEGDEIMIVVNTYDPSSMWAPAPEGTVTVTASFEAAASALFDFYASNLNLGADLTLKYALRKSDVTGEGNYIILTRSYADGSTHEVRIEQADWETSGSFYVVKYSNLAAKEMCDVITAVAYNAEGEAISNPWEDSIASYALRQLNKKSYASEPELCITIVDLLNYGAAAQEHFGYGTDNLANADLTDEQKTWATADTEVTMTDSSSHSENYYGSNVNLGNTITLKVAFKDIDIADVKEAKVTYTDHYGNEVTKSVDFALNGSYVVASLPGMAAADFGTLVTCQLLDADGNVLAWAIDSMESYAARNSAKLSAIVTAMAKLGISSYNYFHRNDA